ncbi:MAG: type II secretion system protein [Patescibacteria group bacterium]|mgnify:CR=1 FL=1
MDKKSAFTVIEMLVVISVIGLLLTTTMVFYGRTGERQIVLFREQTKILNILSRAKFLSVQTFGKTGPVPCGYGVHFEEPQSVILFHDDAEDCAQADRRYSGDAEKVESFILDRAVVFESLPLSDVIFIPPNPTVVLTPEQDQATIVIKTTDDKGKVNIKINNFGQISTQ